jgi:peptidoglycan/LPS O-acetylase OafA/YrhL
MAPLSTTIRQPAPATDPVVTPPVRGERMPHLPGLDGLRGLAVIGVLLFHGGFSWAKGGFLGVSTFFTLSGFLITNLLVREWDATDAIRLGRFWVRRFRRLLPAALVTIGVVGLVWWRIGTPEQLAGLRADMLGALGYAANWRFLTAGTSYADLFSAPSPLQHFWSLAIEEQFYLFFPLVVMGLMHFGGRRLLTAVLVAATAFSVVESMVLGGNIDRVYYGTDTRAAELLFGALLAVWWSGRRSATGARHAGDDGRRATRAADLVGLVALVGVFWAWTAVDQTSERLARGGFPVYALATTVVIYAATRPGLVTRFLSIPALRWAGLVSYGLYLYHWPIFLWLDEERTGLSTTPLFVVRMAVTTAVAVLSYFLLEMPIRRGTMVKTGRAALSAGLAGAAVVASTAFVITLDPPQALVPYADFEAGVGETSVLAPGTRPSDSTVPVTGTVARRVLILGDSGTKDAAPGIAAAFYGAGADEVFDGSVPGFGLTSAAANPPHGDWRAAYAEDIAQKQPDLVVMMLGGWDVWYIEEKGEEAYAEVVGDAVEILSAGGARIVWLSMLPGGATNERPGDVVFEQLPNRFPGIVAYKDIEAALRAPEDAREVDAEPGAETWPRSYVAADGTLVILRKKSDDWHICPDGAERLGALINQAAADLGWATLAAPGWEQGEWRSEARYDDPAGACTP